MTMTMAMNDTNVTSEESSPGRRPSFDYYNIEERVPIFLMRPHNILAVALGLVSIFLNVVILIALYQVRNRITTHYRLIISLAVSDILVSASVLLYLINKIFNPTYSIGNGPYAARLTSRCSFMAIKALNTTGLNITLLNLMMMAMDHYVAIMKPLQYPMIMRKTRVVGTILFAWAIAFLLGFSNFFSAIEIYGEWAPYGFNYCEVAYNTIYQEEYTTFTIAPICLGIMVFIYSRIYMKIRRRRMPGVQETIPRRETRRTTKALVTTLLTLGSFIIAWLPLCLFQISFTIKAFVDPVGLQRDAYVLYLVDRYLFDMLVVNAIIDPVIYTVRMREVRLGFMRMWCSCFPNIHNRLTRSNSLTVTQSMRCPPSSVQGKFTADLLLIEMEEKS